MRIKDDGVLVTDDSSLALTGKLNMSNIFEWFNFCLVKVQVDVSSCRSSDDFPHVAFAIYDDLSCSDQSRRCTTETLESLAGTSPHSTAWYTSPTPCGRVPDFSRIIAENNAFTFDHVAPKFACNFVVSYIFERILNMGSQTGISIHQLATEIFEFLHSKSHIDR